MKKHNVDQKTEEWHQLRKGKITGTTLKAIMGTAYAREEAMYDLIAERLTTGVEMEYENAMERGNRLEPDAIAMFELETGKSVERIGFCERDDNPMISNSPDGLIGDTEAVEAKCPGGKNHVKVWLKNEVPKEYYWQVIQYFVVNDKLKKVHFVSYHPDIPVHPLHIIEVTRKEVEEDIKKAKTSQETIIEEVNKLLEGVIKL